MKLRDIHLLELLELHPDKGTIYFNNRRMLIQSADAMGLLCKELISAFGVDSARRLLLRFGYAKRL